METPLERKTVNNDGAGVEYFVSNQVGTGSTLIISMGIWEPASRAFPLIARLKGRHCIVISYRGRGGSGTPAYGFDWSNHMSDLACVLQEEAVNNPVFLGFSKGVSYMLGYLSNYHIPAKGLIIIDYPAIHSKLEKGAAQFWGAMVYNGYRLSDFISQRALDGIEEESTYKEFYSFLAEIGCPVWLFVGTNALPDIPSNLTQEDIFKYQASVKKLEVVDFEYSGHMILDEELGKAASEIKRILNEVDQLL